MFPLKKRKLWTMLYVIYKSRREILPKYMSENINLPTQLTQCYNFCNIQWKTVVCECIASWITLWLWYTLYSILLHKELYIIIKHTYIFSLVCTVLGTLTHVITQHFDTGFSSQWALVGRDWFSNKLCNTVM